MKQFKILITLVCFMLMASCLFAAVAPTDEAVLGKSRWRIENDGDFLPVLDSTYDMFDASARPAITYLDSIDVRPERGQIAVTDGVTNEYAYGLKIDSDSFFTGGVTTKSYLLWLEGDRPSGSAASGDSNDAYLKIHGRNKAVNTSDYIMRGMNVVIDNSTTGVLGTIDNIIGSNNKADSTSAVNVRGLQVTAENYSSVTGEFGGIDVRLLNEGIVATTEYGIRIQNLNNSQVDAIGSGLLISDSGVNTGYDNAIDLSGASVVQAEMVFSNGTKLFVGSAANGDAVYAEVGSYDAKGSIYLSSAAGAIYVQKANAGAATDWFKVTATDAD